MTLHQIVPRRKSCLSDCTQTGKKAARLTLPAIAATMGG